MNVAIAEEPQKKVFRARKTMKLSDRQQLESLHNIRSSPSNTPPPVNGKHSEGGQTEAENDKENREGVASGSDSSVSVALTSAPSPVAGAEGKTEDAEAETVGVGGKENNRSKDKSDTENEDNGSKTETSPPLADELEQAGSDAPLKISEDACGGAEGTAGGDTRLKPTGSMETDLNSGTPMQPQSPLAPGNITSSPSLSPSHAPESDQEVKEGFLVLSEEEESQGEKEDGDKGEQDEDKMEMDSKGVEGENSEVSAKSSLAPITASPLGERDGEESSGSARKRARSTESGGEQDGGGVAEESEEKKARVEGEELEAQLELKISGKPGSRQRLEKVVQHLVAEQLRVLQLTVFDRSLQELRERVDRIDCATKHQHSLNTLQAKIARLTKKFGAANQAKDSTSKSQEAAPPPAATATMATTPTSSTAPTCRVERGARVGVNACNFTERACMPIRPETSQLHQKLRQVNVRKKSEMECVVANILDENTHRNSSDTRDTSEHGADHDLAEESEESVSSMSEYQASDDKSDSSSECFDRDCTTLNSHPPTAGHFSKKSVSLQQTSTTKKLDKRHYCVYCHKSNTKIARHLERWHSNEADVAHALSFRKGSNSRRKLLEQLRSKGDYCHNIRVLKEGCGELVTWKQPSTSASANDYLPCQHCLGFVLKKDLWKHECSCRLKVESMSCIKKQVQAASVFLLPLQDDEDDEEYKKILLKMQPDDISNHARSDALICKYGKMLYVHSQDAQRAYIGQKMRQLARLVMAVGQLESRVKKLRDLIVPSRFRLVIEGVKKVSGFNAAKKKSTVPSLVRKLGYSLKKCAEIVVGEALLAEDKETEERAKSFIKLHEAQWRACLSSHAISSLHRSKWKKLDIIPLTEYVSLPEISRERLRKM
ncbi:uncharacterized protein LOC125718284 isoform X3 [Brienomyrus brachyistius]|uniref:uncharacterized protein LOC125718284 isoform X3 n=1 Tax=Brienomyrus brachyistius TaxID=42636 RepID=UPI0020B436CC|nr:uncharacterized protein LOC125718284 isoform X3 [Brienomyrus brachyistius]